MYRTVKRGGASLISLGLSLSRHGAGPPGHQGQDRLPSTGTASRRGPMTEREWSACADPGRMLSFLNDRELADDRRLRRFAVACCRRAWPALTAVHTREAVDTCERFADGRASLEDLRRLASRVSSSGPAETGADDEEPRPAVAEVEYFLTMNLLTDYGVDAWGLCDRVAWLVGEAHRSGHLLRSERWFGSEEWWEQEARAARAAESAAQAAILRELA